MGAYSDSQERADTYRLLGDVFLGNIGEETFETLRLFFDLNIMDAPVVAKTDFETAFDRIPPFASVYLHDIHELQDVETIYASEGLILGGPDSVPPDHMGFELLFMSYLAGRERLESQRKFLDEHLMRWAPAYLDALMRSAKTGAVKDISLFTKEFLETEYEELSHWA